MPPCRAPLVPALLLLLPPMLLGRLLALDVNGDAVSAAAAPVAATVRGQEGAAWGSFMQLLDARRGSRAAGLGDLKRYLARFGYMPVMAGRRDPTDAFDEHLEAAVRRYQSALSLPVTGQLDSATLDRIMAPRCGVGDGGGGHGAPVSLAAVRRFTFFKGEPRWTQPDPLVLTYAISPTATVDYLPADTVRAVFRRAFARWARVIPVGFAEADDYDSADIRVGFYVGSHGDGIPFDGPLGVLGHAFSPRNGRLHLDAAERWAVDMAAETAHSAIDLESVATHEIGHVLGLGHSSSPKAVMYPSLSPREKKAELTADDIEGVQWLYGPNPGFSLSSLYQQDAAMAPGTSSWLPLSLVCAAMVMLVTHL